MTADEKKGMRYPPPPHPELCRLSHGFADDHDRKECTMATFTDVFERKEIKYRLNAGQHRAMLRALEGRLVPDAYGRTRVISVYLDTPDRLLIERSLDKPRYKEKLRVRSYGIPAEATRVYVEIKKKFQGIVYKRRVGCSYAAARAYLNGMPYERACGRYPLPDEAMAAESVAPRSLQIAREIDWCMAAYGSLRASMMIGCDRVAYAPIVAPAGMGAGVATGVAPAGMGAGAAMHAFAGVPAASPAGPSLRAAAASPAGSPLRAGSPPAEGDEVRVTFDTALTYRDLFTRGAIDLPLLGAGEAIMEIKSAGPQPLWLVGALGACRAYPSSFSKYGEAYRACAAPPVCAGTPVRKGARCA